MLNDLLQIVVPVFIGVLSGYLINQLPQLRTFRGSKFLVIALVIELALLGGIWTWLSTEAAKASNIRGLLEKISMALLGAFLFNLIQLIFGSWRGVKSIQPTPPHVELNRKTVVKRTTMKGRGNEAKITGYAQVEDTQMDGEDLKFTAEDSHPPSSPKQQGKQNP